MEELEERLLLDEELEELHLSLVISIKVEQ
jgi:hypothetical protein